MGTRFPLTAKMDSAASATARITSSGSTSAVSTKHLAIPSRAPGPATTKSISENEYRRTVVEVNRELERQERTKRMDAREARVQLSKARCRDECVDGAVGEQLLQQAQVVDMFTRSTQLGARHDVRGRVETLPGRETIV